MIELAATILVPIVVICAITYVVETYPIWKARRDARRRNHARPWR